MTTSDPKPLTGPQTNALRALREACDQTHGGFSQYASPRQIAMMLWPDSIGWKKVSRRGSTAAGGALGATMPMKAATLLWRLRDRGFASHRYSRAGSPGWSITTAGRAYLDDLDTPREAE